jgi:hypothetical protein
LIKEKNDEESFYAIDITFTGGGYRDEQPASIHYGFGSAGSAAPPLKSGSRSSRKPGIGDKKGGAATGKGAAPHQPSTDPRGDRRSCGHEPARPAQ